MNKSGIIQTLGLSIIAMTLMSCSSKPSKSAKSSKQPVVKSVSVAPAVVTKNVTAKTTTKNFKLSETVRKAKRKTRHVVRKSGRSHQYYVNKFQAEQRRKKYASIHRARKAKALQQARRQYKNKIVRKPTRRYQAPSYKAIRKGKGSYASLRGDYAQNPQTIAFINKMVSKHGFDRGNLNYIFSNTNLTPFLKRMAYADAYGSKRSPGKRRNGRWTRYRNNFLTPRTINKGVAFARANRVALQRAEDRYGVPKEYILGIIGVETRYGGNVGKNRAIDALAAMGFNNPRRGRYFQKELEAYLLMTRRTGLDPLKPMASYAGALGLCQFMPSNIKRYGVDFDGRGGVNLWTPQDAIASVANYFSKHGWRKGGTVAVPAISTSSGYQTLRTGFKSNHSLSRLKSKGIVASNLGNISGKASLIKLNTYDGDELWLGGRNFYVITRYNHSSHYAMAVHQLAQAIKARIGGRGVIRQASLDTLMKSVN